MIVLVRKRIVSILVLALVSTLMFGCSNEKVDAVKKDTVNQGEKNSVKNKENPVEENKIKKENIKETKKEKLDETDEYKIIQRNDGIEGYFLVKVMIKGQPNKEEIDVIGKKIIDREREVNEDIEKITLNLYDEKTYELDLMTLGSINHYKNNNPNEIVSGDPVIEGEYKYVYSTKDKNWGIDMIADGYIDMLRSYKYYLDSRPGEVISDEEYCENTGMDTYNFNEANRQMLTWMMSDTSRK